MGDGTNSSLCVWEGWKNAHFFLLCASRTTVTPLNKKIQPFKSNTVYSGNYSVRQEVELRKLQKIFRMKKSVFLNITFLIWFLLSDC